MPTAAALVNLPLHLPTEAGDDEYVHPGIYVESLLLRFDVLLAGVRLTREADLLMGRPLPIPRHPQPLPASLNPDRSLIQCMAYASHVLDLCIAGISGTEGRPRLKGIGDPALTVQSTTRSRHRLEGNESDC